jgi:hypothetical protein
MVEDCVGAKIVCVKSQVCYCIDECMRIWTCRSCWIWVYCFRFISSTAPKAISLEWTSAIPYNEGLMPKHENDVIWSEL